MLEMEWGWGYGGVSRMQTALLPILALWDAIILTFKASKLQAILQRQISQQFSSKNKKN